MQKWQDSVQNQSGGLGVGSSNLPAPTISFSLAFSCLSARTSRVSLVSQSDTCPMSQLCLSDSFHVSVASALRRIAAPTPEGVLAAIAHRYDGVIRSLDATELTHRTLVASSERCCG